ALLRQHQDRNADISYTNISLGQSQSRARRHQASLPLFFPCVSNYLERVRILTALKGPVSGMVERIEVSAHPEWRPLRLVARQASERTALQRPDLRFLPAQPLCQGVRRRI